jgi:general secretion pathway protein E
MPRRQRCADADLRSRPLPDRTPRLCSRIAALLRRRPAGESAGDDTPIIAEPMNDVIDSPRRGDAERRSVLRLCQTSRRTRKAHEDGVAQCACRANTSPTALAEARRYLRVSMKLERVAEPVFDELLREAYEGGSETMEAVEGLDETTDLAHLAQGLPEQADLLESEDDAPIIRLINAIFTQAVKENASDIHVEPFENRLVIRFRVDGILREVLQTKRIGRPAGRIAPQGHVEARHRREAPAAGRPHQPAHRRPRGRCACLDDPFGARRARGAATPRQAGRPHRSACARHGADTERLMDELIHKPHGIFLVTGPTGSGKTTTLYAGLERLNDNTRNIITVEDPIEYFIDGVGQTQVNTKVEMTFARGLRAILRQDPDVVMVGEIRDLETAQIAVQASLTGHLVLSTLHTNTAVGAVTRLA